MIDVFNELAQTCPWFLVEIESLFIFIVIPMIVFLKPIILFPIYDTPFAALFFLTNYFFCFSFKNNAFLQVWSPTFFSLQSKKFLQTSKLANFIEIT